jgi:hypothetical protein
MPGVAEANADLKYGTLLDAIQRRIQGVGATQAANEAAIQGYGNTGRGIIGQTYDVLDKALAQNRTDTSNQLGTAAQNIGQGYRDAQSILETQRGIARDYAAQAGVADNQTDAYSRNQARLENVIADLIGRNAQQDATYTGNLKNWAGQMDSIMAKGQDIGRQSRADQAGKFETSLLDALAGNRLNAQTDLTDLYGQQLSTLNERGNFLVSESDRLAQQAWERAIQEAQLQQSAQQANAELALRQRQMDMEQSNVGKDDLWKMLDYGLRRDQFAADQQNTQFSQGLQQDQFNQTVGAALQGSRLDALRILADPNSALLPDNYRAAIERAAGITPPPAPAAPTSLASGGGSSGNPERAAAYGSKSLPTSKTNRGPVSPFSGNMATWVGLR